MSVNIRAAQRLGQADDGKWDRALAARKRRREHHPSWMDVAVMLSTTPQACKVCMHRTSHAAQLRTSAGRFRAAVGEQLGEHDADLVDDAAAFVFHTLQDTTEARD